jgi:hypothetical protein
MATAVPKEASEARSAAGAKASGIEARQGRDAAGGSMRSTKARPRRGDAQGQVTVYGHDNRPTQDDASLSQHRKSHDQTNSRMVPTYGPAGHPGSVSHTGSLLHHTDRNHCHPRALRPGAAWSQEPPLGGPAGGRAGGTQPAFGRRPLTTAPATGAAGRTGLIDDTRTERTAHRPRAKPVNPQGWPA